MDKNERQDTSDEQEEDPRAFENVSREERGWQSPGIGEEGTEEDRRQWERTRDLHGFLAASVHYPPVESLLHCFSVVIPPFSVKRNANLSVCRRQLRSHLWIYFGDRFFVYRCIWDEL
jgi:hypothetical protein